MIEDFKPEKQLDPATDGLIQAFDQLLEDSHAQAMAQADFAAAAQEEVETGCPGADQWLQMALGDALPAQANALFSHAADCSRCAAQLRLSLRLLKDTGWPEEEAEWQGLASATPAWQHSLAVELAQTPFKKVKKSLSFKPLWIGALATSVLLALLLTYFWRQMNTPERLLARAYTHERNLEFRIPGADFAALQPQNHLRGNTGGNESSWLLDAHARIQHNLENAPNDPRWLQLQARTDVLEEKFDAAIDILDRLIAAGPVTADLLTDGASAYYQRGAVTGSENDRASALEYLRRADELSPDNPVILFNEAIALEDRGQVMNAVETWNRFLRFEHDPQWLAEGRDRLAKLELKLTRLKTHESRIKQMLADPVSMRALAGDQEKLSGWDEELSVEWLPELLTQAYVDPGDRSRGSPCTEACQAARLLLNVLAASLQTHHQDPWLSRFLPSSATPSPQFIQAARELVAGLEGVRAARYSFAVPHLDMARQAFTEQGNAAGEDLVQAQLSYAHERLGDGNKVSHALAHPLLSRHPEFAWIQVFAGMQDMLSDDSPGVDAEDRPSFQSVVRLAEQHHYTLLALRAHTLQAIPAVNSIDAERAWQSYTPLIRRFWSGDYPAYRLYSMLCGLADLESKTPRTRLGLLLQHEVFSTAETSRTGSQTRAGNRLDLVAAAIRAGSAAEARAQMALAQKDLAESQDHVSAQAHVSLAQIALARLYTAHHDFPQARQLLDSYRAYYRQHMTGYIRRDAGLAEAELELASGKKNDAETLLHDAILEQEFDARSVRGQYISWARRQRDTYANEAGLWLSDGRSPEEILALWERYRLRILGLPAPKCENSKNLICLQPRIAAARARLGQIRLIGQIVLADRTLIYDVTDSGVRWSTVPAGQQEMSEAAAALERAVSSPNSSPATVDQASQRIGKLLFSNLHEPLKPGSLLVIEPDPALGNLPWPAVETAAGILGLQFNLVESPSLALNASSTKEFAALPRGAAPLVVGASWSGGSEPPLPEVLNEARSVARYYVRPDLLLAQSATASSVFSRMETAPIIHFAGHAIQHAGNTRLLLAPEPNQTKLPQASEPAYLDNAVLHLHAPRAARLVVFSACSTGKRQERWNNGIGDIVNTLAGLGVPEVVATRWEINSASAATIMSSFYEQLAKGAIVPQALTTARISLASDARYRHPYYWAAYYVSGIHEVRLDRIVAAPSLQTALNR